MPDGQAPVAFDLQTRLTTLEQQVALLSRPNVVQWTNITSFTNGYGQQSGGPQVAYRRDASGVVWLTGQLSAGTNGASAFTLPAGFRPATTRQFSISSVGLVVQAGVVQASGAVALFPNGQSNIFLDGITFLGEK